MLWPCFADRSPLSCSAARSSPTAHVWSAWRPNCSWCSSVSVSNCCQRREPHYATAVAAATPAVAAATPAVVSSSAQGQDRDTPYWLSLIMCVCVCWHKPPCRVLRPCCLPQLHDQRPAARLQAAAAAPALPHATLQGTAAAAACCATPGAASPGQQRAGSQGEWCWSEVWLAPLLPACHPNAP